jgi:hypothetical protein
MTIKLKMFQRFSKMLLHFFFNISSIFCQHFTKFCNIFWTTIFVINIFLLPTFFRNVPTFLKMMVSLTIFCQYFAKCYNIFKKCLHIFSIFRLLPTCLRNVGFVNYFCQYFATFFKMLEQYFLLLQPPTGAPAAAGRHGARRRSSQPWRATRRDVRVRGGQYTRRKKAAGG